MTVFFNFKRFIASKLSARFGLVVAEDEIILGSHYPAASILAAPAKEMIVEVSFRGVTYRLMYNRASLANQLGELLIYNPDIVTETNTIDEIIDQVNQKTGLGLDPLKYTIGAPVGGYKQRRIATVGDAEITGSFDAYIIKPTLSAPLHYWPLDNTNINFGTYETETNPAFDFIAFAGENWGTVPASASFVDFGLTFPLNADFTIDFWCVANNIGDLYGHLFSSVTTYDFPNGCLHTWRNISPSVLNAPVMNNMGYSTFANSLFPRLLDDTPMRITIRRTGNVYRWFANGTQVWEFTSTVTPINWRYWGSYYRRSKQYLRGLRFWTKSLSDAEMVELFVLTK